MRRAPTIFIDIDGTIIKHENAGSDVQWMRRSDTGNGPDRRILLDNVWQVWNLVERIGGKIVLCTARPECLRAQTEAELRACGLWWHALVMGITSGDRVLLNDLHPSGSYCVAACGIERNEGLGQLLRWVQERYK